MIYHIGDEWIVLLFYNLKNYCWIKKLYQIEIVSKVGLVSVLFSEKHHKDIVLVTEVTKVDGEVVDDDDENVHVGGWG